MKRLIWRCFAALFILFISITAQAQTDLDADMMNKNLFCSGIMYASGKWDNYWEGTLKRENLNIGSISTKMIGYMGNYGISKKVNILFNLPYVSTKATAGTLQGMKGLQDFSMYVKYRPLRIADGKQVFSLIGVAGFTVPMQDYVIDFLPLSIGLGSKQLIGRIIGDYQYGKFFLTGSGTYMLRSNVFLDRTSYYTTEQHLTNEVKMPDALAFNVRSGYRTKGFIAEALFNNMVTLGGFDITRNNMPFPSNKMNSTSVGLNLRYIPKKLQALTLTAGGDYVVAGRNVGQSKTLWGGLFYIINFNRKQPTNHSFQN
jgi:hypothetical protein